MLLINKTPHTVRMMWVSKIGDEHAYNTLLPGHRCILQTFATHPWVAGEVTSGTCLPINMQEAFCPHKTQRTRQAPAAAAADTLHTQQQQQQQGFSFQSPTGIRYVPFSALQHAEISLLSALPWSQSAHLTFHQH